MRHFAKKTMPIWWRLTNVMTEKPKGKIERAFSRVNLSKMTSNQIYDGENA